MQFLVFFMPVIKYNCVVLIFPVVLNQANLNGETWHSGGHPIPGPGPPECPEPPPPFIPGDAGSRWGWPALFFWLWGRFKEPAVVSSQLAQNDLKHFSILSSCSEHLCLQLFTNIHRSWCSGLDARNECFLYNLYLFSSVLTIVFLSFNSHLPKIYQSFLMSATLSEDVQSLKELLLHNPVISSSTFLPFYRACFCLTHASLSF